MNPIQQYIEKREEEFDKKFISESHISLSGKYHSESIKKIQGEIEVIDKIKSFHSETISTVLSMVREDRKAQLLAEIGLDVPEEIIKNYVIPSVPLAVNEERGRFRGSVERIM